MENVENLSHNMTKQHVDWIFLQIVSHLQQTSVSFTEPWHIQTTPKHQWTWHSPNRFVQFAFFMSSFSNWGGRHGRFWHFPTLASNHAASVECPSGKWKCVEWDRHKENGPKWDRKRARASNIPVKTNISNRILFLLSMFNRKPDIKLNIN